MTTMALHPRTRHHHYRTRAAGAVALRRSLLCLLAGIPAAAVFWRIWSLVFNGPSAAVEPQRFDGWGRVTVQLPGTLLVVGVAVAAVVLAAQAASTGTRHADETLAATGLGLLVTLLVLGTAVLHTVAAVPSATTEWAVRAAALVVSGGMAVFGYLWALDVRR